MIDLTFGFTISAFVAGILTFLAPCTLPLVPAYLGFISGVGTEELRDPQKSPRAKRKIFLNGLAFVVGFSIVFIIFGILAGFFGQLLAPYRIWLGRLGGIFVIIFGLYMLGVFRLSIFSSKNLRIPKWLSPGNPLSSVAVGGAFAFGWTPCVGPILGSILLLAGTSGTALQGGWLLLVFSLGLAIPFLTLALIFSRATGYIEKLSKYLKIVSIVGGVFLIALGLLLITDNFGLVIQYGYKILEPIEYDRLLDYL